MVVETVVGADVVVEIHLPIEIGVAVVGVLHESVRRGVRLAREDAGAADGVVFGTAQHAERGGVTRLISCDGAGDAGAIPRAAVARAARIAPTIVALGVAGPTTRSLSFRSSFAVAFIDKASSFNVEPPPVPTVATAASARFSAAACEELAKVIAAPDCTVIVDWYSTAPAPLGTSVFPAFTVSGSAITSLAPLATLSVVSLATTVGR